MVPLADRTIGNLQQWLIGTYHGVSRAQLQVYLDEFVFRHNRRQQPLAAFQTLLGLGTGRAPTDQVIALRQRGVECRAVFDILRKEHAFAGSYGSVYSLRAAPRASR